jgi:hypothetical protein
MTAAKLMKLELNCMQEEKKNRRKSLKFNGAYILMQDRGYC